jgi:hypothetical protein
LCGAGTDAAIGGLTTMIAKLKRAPKARREGQREACRDFAAAIIESWQPKRHGYSWDDTSDETDRSIFPSLLQQLDDPKMVNAYKSAESADLWLNWT